MDLLNTERILIVDDEEGLLKLLKVTLNKEGYSSLTCVTTGTEALKNVESNQFDLIILDVMLPDYSGFDLCTEIRRHTIAPIIFLTARSSDYDKLSGLAIGGDDYITKPFNTMELVARIKSIFRRRKLDQDHFMNDSASERVFDQGFFVLDASQAILKVYGEEVECTAKELELLEFFCRNPNKVFTASHIYDSVWGLPGYGGDKTVTIHISKLRKKLMDDDKPYKVIKNIRGIGYKFISPNGS